MPDGQINRQDRRMQDLGIVIVNYNTRAWLLNCLESLYASRGELTFQVFVVDNCSSDGSATAVRATFPQVELIESPYNGGYAYANNLALRRLGFHDQPGREPSPYAPRYVLLLNPDTLLPPDALARMVAFLDARPQAGAAGPKLVRPDGSLDKACRRSFPSPAVSFWRLTGLSRLFPRSRRFGRYNLTYIDPDVTIEVDSVVGAFMMVRREAVCDVGLLDEGFFMYGEDLDWAYRIKQAGWQIWYYPEVTVLHYKGASSRQRSVESIRAFYDAMRRFHHKHYRAQTPTAVNWLIDAGITLLYYTELARNALRPPERKGVASAV
ncbi:MAG: glycosyltransferase family 2 protein [Ardenticatenia bacterium]|nr:glycosyltransferase family 2 protein [Ardenticatenia bacterium]